MRVAALVAVALLVAVGGCSTRTITVTSTPSGASVWLNDQSVGRTPVTVDFVYFGVYDVRVELPGYAAVSTAREAAAPWWEWPGVDAVAVALPFEKRTELAWHFDLVEDSGDDGLLLDRAWATRWMTEEGLVGGSSVVESAGGNTGDGGAGGEVPPDDSSGTDDAGGADGSAREDDGSGADEGSSAD